MLIAVPLPFDQIAALDPVATLVVIMAQYTVNNILFLSVHFNKGHYRSYSITLTESSG
jgi:hypothetical protein